MIQNWDLISRRDEETGDIRYALLIDGTEHDARIISKKLGKYLSTPSVAEPPFSYEFLLSGTFDDTQLDRIRIAVSEGVANANRISQFSPEGPMGDTLFNTTTSGLDKTQSIPTFFTLAPSSVIRDENGVPLETKTIKQSLDLDMVTSQFSIQTAPDLTETKDKNTISLDEDTPSDSTTPTEATEPKESLTLDLNTGDTSAQTASPDTEEPVQNSISLDEVEQEPVLPEELTQKEEVSQPEETEQPEEITQPAEEAQPAETEQEAGSSPLSEIPQEDIAEKTSTSYIPATDLGSLSFFAQETPQNLPPQTDKSTNEEPPVAAEPVSTEQQEQSAPDPSSVTEKKEAAAFPLNDHDMLNKDMEGTLLDNVPLEDIFAAETKMDVFVDADSNTQQQQKRDKLTQATSATPPSDSFFDIFEQDLKDQTSVIDLTQLRAKHEQEKQNDQAQPKQNTEPEIPQIAPFAQQVETQSVTIEDKQSSLSIKEEPKEEKEPPKEDISSTKKTFHASRPHKNQPTLDNLPEITLRQRVTDFSADELSEPPQEVPQMDPLEATTHEKPAGNPTPKENTVASKTSMPTLAPVPTPQPEPATKHKITLKPTDTKTGMNTVTNLPRKNTMENKKTILKLKPKPHVPTPPVMKPAAPKVPVAKPPVPTPAPANKPTTPSTPIETEQDPAEKTHTFDHSIQMPRTELKKHNWPLEIPLIPTYTLNNMVMSVNRFAHATAISVIESPGKLYNPLVFYGASGTGKSHILNALAYAFSQKFGQTNIFMTNGVRLSRGIQRYIMEGNIEKFDRFISSVKVLLIDDIHLLAINEQNRSYISKLLNTFLKEQKQIVITSKYPPESLEKLEELIKFHLDSGWISELKSATGPTYVKIVKKMLIDNHVDLSDSQVEEFFCNKDMTLGSVSRSVRRLKVLENLLPQHLGAKQYSQSAILEKLIPSKGEDETSSVYSTDPATITSITPHGNGEWGRIGVFYPQNYAHHMNWMVFALQQRAKELGLEGGFDIVVRSSYATENIISSAFKIANLCDNKKLKGAMILGPSTQMCDPAVRENFYDILTHMLEVMLIRCGIINEESVRLPSTYVKLLSELMR